MLWKIEGENCKVFVRISNNRKSDIEQSGLTQNFLLPPHNQNKYSRRDGG